MPLPPINPNIKGCGYYTLEHPNDLNCYGWTWKYVGCKFGLFRSLYRERQIPQCEMEDKLWRACWNAKIARFTGQAEKAEKLVDEANMWCKDYIKPKGDPVWKKRKRPPPEFERSDIFDDM